MFSTAFLAIFGLISVLYPLPIEEAAAEVPIPELITYDVWVTAYSSTPEETDDTPFITASGKEVRWGIIAANFLEFGTQVQIPELFSEEVFVVEDRMHRRFSDRVDIWMPSKNEAKQFGINRAQILTLVD